MAQSLDTSLQAEVILREMSRVSLPNTIISDLFGWGLAARNPDAQDQGNMIQSPIRESSIDIFNNTRKLPPASTPGTQNVLIDPQNVGKFRYIIPRIAMSLPLTYEQLVQRRQIGQALNIVDKMGETYLMKQKIYMAQLVANIIEFQSAAMLRGTYTFDQQGDELRQGFSGGETTINFQIPAGNKNQLNMLGAGNIISASWATTSTDIPGQVLAVNTAMNALTGYGISHALLNSTTMRYLDKNTAIINEGGSANTPYAEFVKTGPGTFAKRYRAMPWILWHVIDYSLDIWDGSAFTTTKLVADDQVTFIPDPNPMIAQYINGMEVVTEGPAGVTAERYGFYQYGYASWNPAGWWLNAVHNGIPGLLNPNAIATADVTP